ncbi:hypothetical protein [Cellulomonas sp. S1-8]|uniref:hypothetical protein n=1 Tax=Cellulomonas sp. S1-8 TaxID=2904790 RepID=UPI002243E907|nr:hypothetical protein [Cellulomonas sp. S1-8]UZN03129.1 hypothetical protein OKX07_19080 [Cellulomonas sp. S1-8]
MGARTLGGRDRGARTARAAAVVALLVLPLLGPGVSTAAATDVTTVDETRDDVTYYVVQESWEGQPEFLFSIAERLLGTGDRALEIFELNEGRAQPGGMTVSDPNVIRPGWVLLLPPDATGDGVVVGPLPTPAPRAVRATPSASPTSRADERADAPSKDEEADEQADEQATGSAPQEDPVAGGDADDPATSYVATGLTALVAVTAGIAALVLVGGSVVAVTRRRRARRNAPPVVAVRRENPGAWTIDRTTRALARACADAGRPAPAVYAMVVSHDEVLLRLSTPDARPPAGWTAGEDGLSWTSPMRPLQDVALDDRVVAPYPRLVTLGDDAHGRVLLDLAHGGPGTCLDGDLAQALRLAEQWVHELATSPWSRHVPVVTVGVGPSAHARIDDAGPAVDAAGGGVLVVAGARGRDADLLAALAEDPAWSVVVVGAAGRDWARWRLTLDADGVVTGGPLDTAVHLQGGDRRLELV